MRISGYPIESVIRKRAVESESVSGRGRSAESSGKVWSYCSARARASVRTSSACLMSF
jgi:hypothetical protein